MPLKMSLWQPEEQYTCIPTHVNISCTMDRRRKVRYHSHCSFVFAQVYGSLNRRNVLFVDRNKLHIRIGLSRRTTVLEIRPCCEHCEKPLPNEATDAMICSFECTFCADCVDNLLENVCPNCGGGFCPRPSRPSVDLKNGNYLGNNPAKTEKKVRPIDIEAHHEFAAGIKHITPSKR